MATESQKLERLNKVFNVGMYSMIKGLWEMFGESAFATTNSIGDMLLSTLERESGLEIHGENPKDIMQEIVRLLSDEVGVMQSGTVKVDGDKVQIACEKCFLREATGWLAAEGVQPFACVAMGIAAAAMRKRLGTKHRVLGRDWDEATETCTIKFQLLQK